MKWNSLKKKKVKYWDDNDIGYDEEWEEEDNWDDDEKWDGKSEEWEEEDNWDDDEW
jgi:hypothetical protein